MPSAHQLARSERAIKLWLIVARLFAERRCIPRHAATAFHTGASQESLQ